MNGFVYVIGSEDFPFVKIGHSVDVDKRLATLQVGNPYRLKVIGKRPGPMALEQLIHRSYAFQRIRGEWFDFDGADPMAAVDDVIQMVGAVIQAAAPVPVKAQADRMSAEDRDMQLIALISAQQGLSLSQMARKTGASKSVVKRRVEHLSRLGRIFRDSGGMWHPTS